jgi:putative CocE/NonD family hydrolase
VTILSQFPFETEEIENLWIPMQDGVRLAARVFMPTDAGSNPVPAIIEANPYRKRDGLLHRDTLAYRYLAGHGYACLRIDLRGSGDSEGTMEDEYSQQELDDLYAAIAWIAAQKWCSGRVGMTGKSWSGFNALQVAAMQPPALKAIIPVHAAADRYADDVHYMGGTLIHDNFAWASIMYSLEALPPDPAVVGDAWRDMWQQRLDHMEFWLKRWAEHQRRDAYWRHASVCEDFSRIRCPILSVGGWEDGYSNTVPMLLEGCPDIPVHGLTGPWGHAFPFNALPAPQIGYLQYCLRWWDRWLKDADTGIDREPAYRVWMNDSYRPDPNALTRDGNWIVEDRWPSDRIATRSWHLAPGMLADRPGGDWQASLRSPADTGITNLEWCSQGDGTADLASDQRADDARSLTFDTEPLEAPTAILGAPVVELIVSADRPQAKIAVRLCDVWPDGASSRVTFMLFNLAHRDGHASPSPLEPGKRYRVRIALNHVAHRFRAGNRIRIAVSSEWWPIMWPSPEAATITIHGESQLHLPMRPDRPEDSAWADLGTPETAPPVESETLREGRIERTVTHDIGAGTTTVRMVKDSGSEYLPTVDIQTEFEHEETYSVTDGDPLSATAETRGTQHLSRDGWRIDTRARTTMRATKDAFLLTAEMDIFENERRIRSLNETYTIPRDNN